MKEKDRCSTKTNALLIGPTGCGKTHTARSLARIDSLPFLRIDATNLVQNGYRGGMHVEQIPAKLIAAAKGNRSLAGYGIIFLDEIDKITYDNPASGDVATIGVQQDLLSIIDGGDVFYSSDSFGYSLEKFDFSNVLFIFGGAFEKLQGKMDIGVRELVKYGLIPEFANRLGSIIQLEPLSGEVIRKLIRKEVEDYSTYVSMTTAEVSVYAELIHSIIMASKAHEEMGGRCVGPMVRRFFEDRMFEVDKKEATK